MEEKLSRKSLLINSRAASTTRYCGGPRNRSTHSKNNSCQTSADVLLASSNVTISFVPQHTIFRVGSRPTRCTISMTKSLLKIYYCVQAPRNILGAEPKRSQVKHLRKFSLSFSRSSTAHSSLGLPMRRKRANFLAVECPVYLWDESSSPFE